MEEIPAKYFAADLEATDLMGIVSAHPYLFWTGLGIVVAVCLWYGVKYFIKKKVV